MDIKKRGSTVSKNIELDVVVNVDTTQLKIKHRIGFVGAGKMAYSIVKGLIRYCENDKFALFASTIFSISF